MARRWWPPAPPPSRRPRPAPGWAAAALVPVDLVGADVDYDELALALLRRVARSLTETSEAGASNLGTARAQRRIVNLERRINEMERTQARAHAENAQL